MSIYKHPLNQNVLDAATERITCKSKKADFLLSINEGYILKREMAVNITAIRIYFCVICSTNLEKTELLSAERL